MYDVGSAAKTVKRMWLKTRALSVTTLQVEWGFSFLNNASHHEVCNKKNIDIWQTTILYFNKSRIGAVIIGNSLNDFQWFHHLFQLVMCKYTKTPKNECGERLPSLSARRILFFLKFVPPICLPTLILR